MRRGRLRRWWTRWVFEEVEESAGVDDLDAAPDGREVAEVAGDDMGGAGGEGGVEQVIVVGVGAGVTGGGGVDVAGDGEERGDGGFEGVAVFRELGARGDVAVLGFERGGEGDLEGARGGEFDHARLVAAGLPAGGDEDIGVEDDAHGRIGSGMNDELGNRIKSYYEDPARVLLPRKTWVVIRVDGKGFHTFTRRLERPYSRPLADALDRAAVFVASQMAGFAFAYGQSDEYSFLMTDFGRDESRMWFEGSVQKLASVTASLFTAGFHRAYADPGYAAFDARVFAIPQRREVERYFLWRQADATRNSLNMLTSAHYTHEELLGKSAAEKHDLLHAKGENWAKWPADFKRGRVVRPDGTVDLEIPVFTREPAYLDALIPHADTL